MRKKVFASIVFLVTMLFAVVGWAADWYVRPAGGDYGNEDGTSYENAWNGFSNIVWGAGGVQAGDTLWLDGEFRESLPIGASGTVNNLIQIRAYNEAVINGSDDITSVSWEEESTNVWRYNIGSTDPRIVVFNDTQSGNRVTSDPTAQFEWTYSDPYIKIYSEGEPSSYYSKIEAGVRDCITSVFGDSYIRLQEITFTKARHVAYWNGAPSNVIFAECRFIKNGGGITFRGVDSNTYAEDCKVIDCYFNDVRYTPNTDAPFIALTSYTRCCNIEGNIFIGDSTYTYGSDGIIITDTCKGNGFIIRRNYFAYFYENAIDIKDNSTSSAGEDWTVISDNIIEHTNQAGIVLHLGASKVEIIRNTIRNCTHHGILLVGNNGTEGDYRIAYNLIASNDFAGISDNYSNPVQGNVEVINNILANNGKESGGARTGIYINSPNWTIENNIFINNETGETDPYQIYFIDPVDIGSCVLGYNCLWVGTSGSKLYRAGNDMYTLSEFRSTYSQSANSKEQDPLLTSNYHLSPNSPCIDAGIKLPIHDSNWRDLAGNRIRYGTAPDIGCYEYKTWPLGAWGMLPWIGGRYKVQWTPYE